MKQGNRKRVYCLALAAGIILSLAACSSANEALEHEDEESSKTASTFKEESGTLAPDIFGRCEAADQESEVPPETVEEEEPNSNTENSIAQREASEPNQEERIEKSEAASQPHSQSTENEGEASSATASISGSATFELDTPTPASEPTSEPTPESTPESTPTPTATDMGAAYKKCVLSAVNSYRETQLEMDSELSATAQAHAEAMALRKSTFHSCKGVESVGSGAYEDGYKQGVALTMHCSTLAEEKVVRIGVGAARDENGSIYVCIFGKTY